MRGLSFDGCSSLVSITIKHTHVITVQVSSFPLRTLRIRNEIPPSRLSKHYGVEILGSGDMLVAVSMLRVVSWTSNQIVARVVDSLSYYQELVEKLMIVNKEFSGKCGTVLPVPATFCLYSGQFVRSASILPTIPVIFA